MNPSAAADVETAFRENFARGRELGASVSLWREGEEILCLSAGWPDARRMRPWTDDTLVLIWSATKGPSSACVLHALERAGLDPNVRVAEVWPEFARNGKDRIRVADVLAHRAGLSAFADATIPVLDHAAAAASLAAQAPLWTDGGHGYGPLTFGFLADELVRRLTGNPLGAYWREVFGDPLGIDLWIGLPEALHDRVAQIVAPRPGGSIDDFARAVASPGTLAHAAFSQLGPLRATVMNSAAMRSASFPALGGIASARGLAKFYALLANNGTLHGREIVSPRILREMSTRISQGPDRTLCAPTAFSAGFMMDVVATPSERRVFGPSPDAFGHPGAGGSIGFADPRNAVGFAYVMNQMELGALPGERTRSLVRALYG